MKNRAIDLQENWIKWNPGKLPKGSFTVIDFSQNSIGTKIVLENEQCYVEVFFNGVTPMVRTALEGVRMRTWSEVQEKYNDKYFFRDWFLYKVENSKFCAWVEEESCGFYEKERLIHFCIVTDDIIDILSTFEPTVRIIQDNEIE